MGGGQREWHARGFPSLKTLSYSVSTWWLNPKNTEQIESKIKLVKLTETRTFNFDVTVPLEVVIGSFPWVTVLTQQSEGRSGTNRHVPNTFLIYIITKPLNLCINTNLIKEDLVRRQAVKLLFASRMKVCAYKMSLYSFSIYKQKYI